MNGYFKEVRRSGSGKRAEGRKQEGFGKGINMKWKDGMDSGVGRNVIVTHR